MEWVTIDRLSNTLKLPKAYLRQLTRQGFLVTIGKGENQRWLDPTEEYREKLRLAAVLHHRALFVPPDVSEIALLTLREVAEICGWSLRYAQIFMHKNRQVPRFKVNPQLCLYAIKDVREILWRRQGRKYHKQLSPFLVTELIAFFQKEHDRETKIIPTDAEYVADETIMRKLEAIVRRSEKDQKVAKHDFARKAELARKIVEILRTAEQLTDPKAS